MTVVAVGNVFYSDDPDQKIFRRVYILDTDPPNEVNDPKWTTANIDSSRMATLVAILPTDPAAILDMTGTPGSPPTQGGLPVVTPPKVT